VRFRHTIKSRILAGLLIPSIVVIVVIFLSFRVAERRRIRGIGTHQLQLAGENCGNVLSAQRGAFAELTLRLGSDIQMTGPFKVGMRFQLQAYTDLLTEQNHLAGLALFKLDGSEAVTSGEGPGTWRVDIATECERARQREERVFFATKEDGEICVVSVAPLISTNKLIGFMLLARSLDIETDMPSTVAVSGGETRSWNPKAAFMLPFVDRVTPGPGVEVNSFEDGSIRIGRVLIPGLPFEEAHLLVGLDHREVYAESSRIGSWGAVVGAALLAILLLYASLLTRALTRPLHDLVRVAETLPGDRGAVDWPADRPDEIGVLNVALRRMTEAFQESELALQQHQEELESRVGRRTKDLIRINTELRDEVQGREKVQGELLRAKEGAEAASATKSLFLANMSHEVRTPINGIMGMTDLMLDTDLSDEQAEYMEMIGSSVHSLLDVINDILDFSKIEAGKMRLDPVRFGLRACLSGAMDLLAVQAFEKGVELTCRVPPSVPDTIIQDSGRLRQVIVNLVGNAIKFTNRGEVALSVEVEEGRGNECHFHFAVRDTGLGISPEHQKRVFDAFEQADASSTREHGGTGLGLSIAATLVRMMGGRILVESELGAGSTFHVFMPAEVVGEMERSPDEADIGHFGNRPVLIVDDNPTSSRILEELTSHLGLRPHVLGDDEDPQAALESAEAGYPLVIVDACDVADGGFDLAKSLSGDPSTALLLMLSPADLKAASLRCREIGAVTTLTKPVTELGLRTAISHALGLTEIVEEETAQRRKIQVDSGRSLRILLAEDNAVNQKVAVRILEKGGHSVQIAYTGREAVDLAESGSFDAILMDVQMPELDGANATALIRERERGHVGEHISIIAMTAHAMKGDREHFLESGMDDYLAKPVKAAELLEVLGRNVRVDAGAPPAPVIVHEPVRSGTGVFDVQEVLMRLEDDEELLVELAQIYSEDWIERRRQMRTALEEGNLQPLAASAHELIGATGNLGPRATLDVIRKLEAAALRGDLDAATLGLGEVEREIDTLVSALEGVITDGFSPA
jgi:signal transduction histidine kinase/DNA-binding response OmpR family regulator